MRFIQFAMILALGLMFMSGASVRSEEELVGDLKAVQGKWTTESGQGGKVTWTIKGNKLKVEAPSRTYEITLTLKADAKPEKTIDFKIDEAPEDSKGKTSLGIYKLDGNDKLIFCFAPEGGRPKEYKQVGYEQILSELKRVKE